MAKLVVTLDAHELLHRAIGAHPVTIGRLPDNLIVIDNPTVSAHHARVYREGPHYVLEDLQSTNGTFVNDQPIARHSLAEGDVVVIGKHVLLFSREGAAPEDESAASKTFLPETDDTVPVSDAVVPKTALPARGRIASLKVIAGDSAQSEYHLAAMTTLIGKGAASQIRLRGWFKPEAAAAIMRSGDTFTITPMDGKVSVNGERISERRDLAAGDLIEVSGLKLELVFPDP
jgi:pSer/pThr/pTyr-binding forkhead associated (FHA) protein